MEVISNRREKRSNIMAITENELIRKALSLYPHIQNQTISHGRAAELLGIRKSELIELYDKLGYSYLNMIWDELDDELNAFRRLKSEPPLMPGRKIHENKNYF